MQDEISYKPMRSVYNFFVYNNNYDGDKKRYISGVQEFVRHSHVMSFCKRLEYICIADKNNNF